MTCTRTGALIFIEPYHEYAYGDAFEVAPFNTKDEKLIRRCNQFLNQSDLGAIVVNIAYFKIVARSFSPINLNVKHYTVHDFIEWIDQGEVESKSWPPSILITNNFTSHGYNGVPI